LELKKKLIYLLGIMVAIILALLPTYFWYDIWTKKKLTELAKGTHVLNSAANAIHKRWSLGDYDGIFKTGEKKCGGILGKIKNLDPFFFRCNPKVLQCLFEKDPVKAKYGSKIYNVNISAKFPPARYRPKTRRIYRPHQIAEDVFDGVEIELKFQGAHKKYRLQIWLQNICSDSYLPQRFYGHGARGESDQLNFDNFGRTIFIDKFLVRNSDITEWIDTKPTDQGIPYPKVVDFPKPATNLSLNQMKAYCQHSGKRLLTPHLFDAASFLPRNFENPKPIKVYKPLYPWGHLKSQFFLHGAQKRNTKIKKEDCRYAIVEECMGLKTMDEQFVNSTWIEMYQSLGGVFEAFNYSFSLKKNLKLSSKYLKAASRWHQIGKYVDWDGVGFGLNSFGLGDSNGVNIPFSEDGKFEVGFRCYRELSK
jgi:hypothetical protein